MPAQPLHLPGSVAACGSAPQLIPAEALLAALRDAPTGFSTFSLGNTVSRRAAVFGAFRIFFDDQSVRAQPIRNIGWGHNVRQAGFGKPPGPEIYSLMGEGESTGVLTIAIRTQREPNANTIRAIADAVSHHDTGQIRPTVTPLNNFLGQSISARRAAARFGSVFAALSLLLAHTGHPRAGVLLGNPANERVRHPHGARRQHRQRHSLSREALFAIGHHWHRYRFGRLDLASETDFVVSVRNSCVRSSDVCGGSAGIAFGCNSRGIAAGDPSY
jgi:hypothetical protein